MSFELLCRYWNPHQVEKLNYTLPTSMQTPDWLETEGWHADFRLAHHQWIPKIVHELMMPPRSLNSVNSSLTQPGWVTQSWRPYPAASPFGWQSNQAILSCFTPNSGSICLFCTSEKEAEFQQRSPLSLSFLPPRHPRSWSSFSYSHHSPFPCPPLALSVLLWEIPLLDTPLFSSFSHFLSVCLKNLSCVPFLHVCDICGPS